MKKHYRSENNCLNCGTTVPDKFCPSCGQENLELHENFLHLMLHSVSHYFHFESKFFKSIVPLFTKPGYLTKEYFAGKRASHLNPISMYIFISILFFFLFTANSNSNKKDIIKDNKAQESTTIEQAKPVADNKDLATASNYTYTVLNAAPIKTDCSGKHNNAVIFTAPTDTTTKKGDAITIVGGNEITTPLQAKFRQVLDDDLSSELFKNKLVSHLPKIMFILLPLFALILKLVNRRAKKFYAEHLVYSIHVHSFLFLFGSILILLRWMLPFVAGWILFIGFLVMLWYIYRSMRNIYSSSRWRTIYKFCLLGFAYSLLMFLSGVVVVIATLYTM